MTVDMAEVAVRVDAVAHRLFQGPDIGKAAIALALPHEVSVESDPEDATIVQGG